MATLELEKARADRTPGGPAFRAYSVVVSSVALAMTFVFLAVDPGRTSVSWAVLMAWLVVVVLSSLCSVSTRSGTVLTMELPVLLAAGFTLGPGVAGALTFAGSTSLSEWTTRLSPWRSLSNRGIATLSVVAGATAFSLAGGQLGIWPRAAIAAIAAVAADSAVNYGLVGAGVALFHHTGFRSSYRGLTLGSPRSFAFAYAGLGFLGILFAEMYRTLGVFGLLAIMVPVALTYQAFRLREATSRLSERIRRRDVALTVATERAAGERQEERLTVAGELHDEVLPPLFKVHLMGQVLRQDIASGRLLDLDQDLPELLTATEAAQTAIRGVVRGLRTSSLGLNGLQSTIRLLADRLEMEGGPRFSLSMTACVGSPLAELLIYQVAREAMTNAARYALVERVSVRLWCEGSSLRIVVDDSGVGFDPSAVNNERHFGLQFLMERVDAAGGHAVVESEPGRGTRVAAAIPVDL